jgi:hypothetical protein
MYFALKKAIILFSNKVFKNPGHGFRIQYLDDPSTLF